MPECGQVRRHAKLWRYRIAAAKEEAAFTVRELQLMSLARAFLLLLTLSLAAIPAYGAQSSQAIVNGQVESEFSAVVGLGAGGLTLCTGTIIAPRVVLTAGHCLDNFNEDLIMAFGRAYVGTEANDPEYQLGFASVLYHPEYTDDEFAFDVGVLELSDDSPVEAVMIRTRRMNAEDRGRELIAVGFGDALDQGDGGTKRSAPITLDFIYDHYYEFRTNTNPGGGNICSGDSGGASLTEEESGRWTQWGIHSFGDEDCTRLGADTRTDVFADWILDFVEAVHGTRDQCEANGFYDDGLCDENCDQPDPDCLPDRPDPPPPPTGCQGCPSPDGPQNGGLSFLPLVLLGLGIGRLGARPRL